MKLLHAMLRVKDIQKSLDFYEKLLGMKEVKALELEDSKLHYLADEYGDVQIELTENFQTPENGYENGNSFGHFAFETESFDDFNQKMKKAGLTYLYEPFVLESANLKIAFLKDPDGNEIEIIENKLSQY